jgi:hypothetical protein
MCGIEGYLDRFFPSLSGREIDNSYLGQVVDRSKETTEAMRLIIDDMRNRKAHLDMHDSMTVENREWWVKQGIPPDWQDFWKLGFVKDKHICIEGTFYIRDAYSIPKFGMDGLLYNIDYRIVNPPLVARAGKYRPEPGIPVMPFISRPDFGEYHKDGRTIIVEGSKKAMVLSIYLDEQVIGVPACRSWAGVVDLVKNVSRVIVLLDPDAEVAASKMVEAIGDNAKRVTFPTKPDDAFLMGALDQDGFWKLVDRNSRR